MSKPLTRIGRNGARSGLSTPTALVTDGALRTSLLVVRSLGRRGVLVDVTERTSPTIENLAGLSRHVRRRITVPNNLTEPDRYADALLDIAENYDVIVPTGMHSIEAIAQRRAEFDAVTCMLLPSATTIGIADNTRTLLDVARRVGVPVPRSWELRDYPGVAELAADVTYPAIVKTGMDAGLPPADRYQVVYTASDLDKAVKRMSRITPEPLIQDLVPGPIVGYEAVYDQRSRLAADFTHRRLRQYPLTGGPSTFCESCHVPAVEHFGRALLDKLGWVGLAMVEFKVDARDGIPRLMEINPRPWGSMALPIRAGVDFPWLAYRLARHDTVDPISTPQERVRLRYVINDLQAAVAEWNLASTHRERWHIVRTLLDPSVMEGILSIRDPLPSLAYIWKAVKRGASHKPVATT